jgi:hypothetical protein
MSLTCAARGRRAEGRAARRQRPRFENGPPPGNQAQRNAGARARALYSRPVAVVCVTHIALGPAAAMVPAW